jgi:short-subunit dehydrogenase
VPQDVLPLCVFIMSTDPASTGQAIPLRDIDYATSTALVTGGSSGIGHAIAQELLSRGLGRLVIVGQNADKLKEAASRLQQLHPNIVVRTVVLDLKDRQASASNRKQLQEWNWTLDILVNDAGFARKYVFARDPETHSSLDTIDLMIRSVVDLSLQFLPGMVQQGRGGILNVASTAGYQPVPYTALYAASKAFILSWSQAFREENRDAGVRVACIVPGITSTNLDGQGHGESRGLLDHVGTHQPEDVAMVAVDAFENNDAAKIVGWNNRILEGLTSLVPDSAMASIVAKARGKPADE